MKNAMLQTLTRCAILGGLAMMGCNPAPANTDPATPDSTTPDSATPDSATPDSAIPAPAKNDSSLNEPDEQGMTPLMNAAMRGSKEEVEKLIKAGADVNATGVFHNTRGITPLMIASYYWNDEIAKLLIEAGADPNAMSGTNLYPKWSTDLQNETALYFAEKASEYFGSIGGNPALTEPSVLPLVKRLIAAGAAPSVKTRMGETPLMLAASNLHLQVADALIKAGANVNSEDLGHATPLIHAARASDKPGFEKMVELLLFAGAKRNVVSHGETPLLAALSHQGAVPDPSEAVKLLLSIGITPNQASPNGTTPLMLAAGTGYLESVKALLDAGADAMRASNNGDTPLSFLAVSRRDEESVPIAKLLIEAGVNVNAQDNEGDYALLIAALLEKKDLVKFLLASGANPKLQNQYGLSAEQIMKSHCGETYYRSNVDPPSADEEQLFYAAFSGNADLLRALVKKGVSIDSKTRTGEQLRIYPNRSIELTSDQLGHCTRKDHSLSDSSKWNNTVVYPSYGTSRDGYTTWALQSVSQNLKVDYYDYVFGYTPFMMAAEQHRSDAVQEIIGIQSERAQSKEELYGRLGKMLLLATSVGYEDSVELLLKAGAMVNPTSPSDSTPLMAAIEGEQWKMARRLIADGAQVEVSREYLSGPFHGPQQWTKTRESQLLRAIRRLTSSRTGVSKEALELIQAMIDAGADLNAKDNWENTPLTLAARYNLTEVARILLKAGADPNLKDSSGKTALDLVGLSRNQNKDDDEPADPEELKALLREAGAKEGAGSDVNVADKEGMTLMDAAKKGNEAVMKRLIDAKADINAKAEDGRTPLFFAIEENQTAAVKLLIEAGADVKVQTNAGDTPLMYAALEGNEAIVKFLLDHGAEVNVANEYGDTALMYAAEHDYEAAKLLLNAGADINAKNDRGRTPLFYAADNYAADNDDDSEAIVKALLDAGADVHVVDKDGETALHLAILNEAVVKLLVDAGINVNVADKEGMTPLMWAAQMGNEASVKLLLGAGANVNAQKKTPKLKDWQRRRRNEKQLDSHTALQLAAAEDHAEVVKLLIAAGANVNLGDENGMTPLMWAAAHGNIAMAKTLIAAKVKVNAKDKDGVTAFMIAVYRGEEEMVKLLLDAGANANDRRQGGDTVLISAIEGNNEALVKLLLAAKAKVDQTGLHGFTPLEEAIFKDNEAIVEALIDAKANVNRPGEGGYTPLMRASADGKVEIVKRLIAAGAKVNAQDELGVTPLMRGAQSNSEAVVKALLEAGANVHIKNKLGTPLLLWGDSEAVKELLRAAGAKEK